MTTRILGVGIKLNPGSPALRLDPLDLIDQIRSQPNYHGKSQGVVTSNETEILLDGLRGFGCGCGGGSIPRIGDRTGATAAKRETAGGAVRRW